MANSAVVATGDVAQASQYNNLRLDVLNTTSGHTHAGTTDTGIKINSNNLQGTTLASTVVASSLTSVGTLTTLTVDNIIINGTNIGHTSDTDAIAISSGGVVTMNQIPVFSAGINVSGGTIAGTLSTAAQGNITSLGTLTTLTVDNVIINGTTIGHTSDTDLLTLASGNLTIGGTTTLGGHVLTGGDRSIYGSSATSAGGGARLRMLPNSSSTPFIFYTQDNDDNADVIRLKLPGGGLTTGTVAWENINVMTIDQAATIQTTTGALTIDGDDGIVLNTGGSGGVQVNEELTVGVDDTGYDVKFFGATAGTFMLWDESDDRIELESTSTNPAVYIRRNENTSVGDTDFSLFAYHNEGGSSKFSGSYNIDTSANNTGHGRLRLRIGNDDTGNFNAMILEDNGSITVGGAIAHDAGFIFDGNAQDYYIGLDDGTDKLHIATGSTVGSGTGMILDSSGHVTFENRIFVGSDGSGQDQYWYGGTTGRGFWWDASDDRLEFADSTPIVVGTGVDLKIYHESDNSIIVHDNADGEFLLGTNTEVRITKAVGGEFLARFIADSGVYLYHNNELAMYTSTAGIVIGDAEAEDTKIVFDGNAQDFYIGLDDGTDDLYIGTGSTVGSGGALSIDGNGNIASYGDITYQTTNSGGTNKMVLRNDGTGADSHANHQIVIEGSNTASDAWLNFTRTVSTNIDWSIGMNNGSSQRFEIANDANLQGSNKAMSITTGLETTFYNDVYIAGTTPRIVIGDGEAEDTAVVWDGNATDWYAGLDDSGDNFVIGEGYTVGSATRMRIQKTGNHYFGMSTSGTFTSSGTSSVVVGLALETALTAVAGDTSYQAHFIAGHNGAGSITTQNNSETIALVSTMYFSEPDITKGSDTITAAATVYISGYPTEGEDNYSLYVGAGAARFNGGFYLGNSNNTNSKMDDSSVGSGSTTMYIGNASITTSSDTRLKTDIKPTSIDALGLIDELNVCDFGWNDPADTSEYGKNYRGRYVGMLAQETVKVAPWIINDQGGGKDCPNCMSGLECDTHGMFQVEYQHLVPTLVKAVQQLRQELKELQNG